MVTRRKANVNVKGDMQWKPLHFASSHGHLEVVKLFVERKANVSAQVRDHVTTALPCTSRRDGDTSRLCECCFKIKQTCTSGEMTVGRRSRPQ
jgi:ankyrin repeat protein